MPQPNTKILIMSIKSASSPKLALNGAKELFQGLEGFSDVSKACFDEAWNDSTKFNASNTRRHGKAKRPVRVSLEPELLAYEVGRVMKHQDPIKAWGELLIVLDTDGLRQVHQELWDFFEKLAEDSTK